MKIQANELNKILKNGDKVDEDSFLETFDTPTVQKMHTPDIAEKRKSMAVYKSPDPKRRFKKTY